MTYFSRRNQHVVEYSGFEEASVSLRHRIVSVLQKYVGHNNPYGDADWYIEKSTLDHEVKKEFPGAESLTLILSGEFHQVFTIIEILLDLSEGLYFGQKDSLPVEVQQAFDLSGSVYTLVNKRIELRLDEETAIKIGQARGVLENNATAHERFSSAVGSFFGRRAKPEDVAKDIFVAAEDYLKEKTGTSTYGNAVKALFKSGIIRKEQKAILEKLYEFRSDAEGVGHAGSSPSPTEHETKWFIETMATQLVFIDERLKHGETTK